MSRRISTRVVTPKVPDPVERSPRLIRRLVGRPFGLSLVKVAAPLLYVLVAAALAVAAAALFAPLPRPTDLAILVVAALLLAGAFAYLRWGKADELVTVARSLAFSAAKVVGFAERTAGQKPRRLVVAACPQLTVVRVLPPAPVKTDPRMGKVFIGGAPLSKLAPVAEAAELQRLLTEAGVQPAGDAAQLTVDVVVAVDDTAPDAPTVDPTFVPLSKKQSVWLVPLSALAGLILTLPARISEESDVADVVRNFIAANADAADG